MSTLSCLRPTLLAGAILVSLAAGPSPAIAQEDWRRQVFGELDIDGDGQISRTEFEFKKVAVIYRNARGRQAQLRIEDTRLSPRAFEELDLEKTGVLDVRDIAAAPLFQFDHWDLDRDGVIEWIEFNAVLDELQN
jgi:hypothetical protein